VPRQARKRATRPPEKPETALGPQADETATQRLDKWLWFARFARTRSLAARLVEDGKIRVNREKILKPAQSVRAGDVITAAIGGRVRVVRIAAPGARRGPAEEARTLYEDLTPPAEPANANAENASAAPARAPGAGRPTKRERRRLDAARTQAADGDRS
jgi:ribosome-associated heat shock protein Hsp15